RRAAPSVAADERNREASARAAQDYHRDGSAGQGRRARHAASGARSAVRGPTAAPMAGAAVPWSLLLEEEPQAELDVATAAVLARDAAEVAAERVAVDAVQVRVVREVEDLGPELRPARAAEIEVLEEREIPLHLAGVVVLVARRVPPGAVGRSDEHARVERHALGRAVVE